MSRKRCSCIFHCTSLVFLRFTGPKLTVSNWNLVKEPLRTKIGYYCSQQQNSRVPFRSPHVINVEKKKWAISPKLKNLSHGLAPHTHTGKKCHPLSNDALIKSRSLPFRSPFLSTDIQPTPPRTNTQRREVIGNLKKSLTPPHLFPTVVHIGAIPYTSTRQTHTPRRHTQSGSRKFLQQTSPPHRKWIIFPAREKCTIFGRARCEPGQFYQIPVANGTHYTLDTKST